MTTVFTKKERREMKSLPPSALKKILEEILIDMLNNRKKEVYHVILDAMEDYGLSRAIKEGRKNKFVSEIKILSNYSSEKSFIDYKLGLKSIKKRSFSVPLSKDSGN